MLLSKVLVRADVILSCRLSKVDMYSFGLSARSTTGGAALSLPEERGGEICCLTRDLRLKSLTGGFSDCFTVAAVLPVETSDRALLSISANERGSPRILRAETLPSLSSRGFLCLWKYIYYK